MSKTIFLASKSPRRRELLEQLGFVVKLVDVNVPEVIGSYEHPQNYVARLAREKALAGVAALDCKGVCLGADTIGIHCDGRLLEKPMDKEDFMSMFKLMSGKSHQVVTSVVVADDRKFKQSTVETEVEFVEVSNSQAEAYWNTGEPRDKAGGYGIQGRGAMFVRGIVGSYSSVVGLPLAETCELLDQFNIRALGQL